MATLSPDTVRCIEDAAAGAGAVLTSQLWLFWQAAVKQAEAGPLAAQLQDTKSELKESREDDRPLQAELLALARHGGKVKK